MFCTSCFNDSSRTRSLNLRHLLALRRVALAIVFHAEASYATPSDNGRVLDNAIEVTVQADRSATTPGSRDPSIASATLTRARLAAPGLQAGDVLRTQPGVIITASGGLGASTTVCMRGGNPADTAVYLAGVRLNDDIGGAADLSMIPLWLIHHIEIYRGNAPLEADRMGPGGAIFFEPIRPTKAMGSVGYYAGSWGTSRGWAYRGGRHGAVSYLVGLSADRASNRYPFVDDRGMLLSPGERPTELRRNADERTMDAWAIARIELGNGFVLDWLSNALQREQGVPRLALLQSRAARQATTRTLASLSLKGPVDAARNATFETRLSVLTSRMSYDDPLRELGLYTPKLTIDDRRVEQEIAIRFDPSESFRLRPAVNWSYETIDRNPNDIPLAYASRLRGRFASNVEVEVNPYVTLRGLANVECHQTGVNSNGYCAQYQPTGRVGGELHFDAFTILASAGRYLRVPTLGELYGVSGTVHGNPALEPESGKTLDLGLRAAANPGRVLRKIYLDAFGYERWADELIAYARTGQGYVRPYNVQAARVRGLEILLGGRVTQFIGLEVTGTLMDPRDASRGRLVQNAILPYRSRLIVAPRARFDWMRKSATGVSGAGAQLTAFYQSSRFADPAGLAIIDEQLTIDLETHLEWFDGLLTVRGRVADLFDVKRTDLVGYPLPGRSIYLGLEAQY